jgi:hypothetical protein
MGMESASFEIAALQEHLSPHDMEDVDRIISGKSIENPARRLDELAVAFSTRTIRAESSYSHEGILFPRQEVPQRVLKALWENA